MKRIPLTKGREAWVDDADYETVMKHKWYFSTGSMGYAARGISRNGKKRTLYMHREILNAGKGETVDHRNHDTLDNRRKNLRKCTFAENHRNMQKCHGASCFKGVYKSKCGWQARISVDGKLHNLGHFKAAKDAATAYNAAAQALYGEYAWLNPL